MKKVISSKNIVMRKLQLTDEQDFFEILGSEEVMLPIPLPISTRSESDQHLKDVLKNSNIQSFAILQKESHVFIGFCAIVRDNEILYRLKPKFWRKGYGKETVEALIKYCFEDLQLEYITAEANQSNIGSVKILERFMTKTRSYFNEEYNCVNLAYKLIAPNL